MVGRGHTKIDLSPLRDIVKDVSNGRSPEMKACYRKWGKRYETFIRRDFVKQSRGGMRWPKLSPATIKARKKKGKGAMILRDTGTLLNALTIGAPGNHFSLEKNGCTIGFGGSTSHPEGKASIADIARFHDEGTNKLPRRQILINPDQATVDGMGIDVKTAISRMK